VSAKALFLDVRPGTLGRRFGMHHVPSGGPVRGLVVYVHPFAEEMNKSRRMAALHSTALAASGWAVLQLDLMGCGDSTGDFGEASWDIWVDDVVRACEWLRRQHDLSSSPLCIWGLRAGCMLAAQAVRYLDGDVNLLFWQPVVSGQILLQQFLRLKLASDLIGGTGKQALDAARQSLAGGTSVEIAGYTLSPALAQGLSQCRLEPPSTACNVDWFELASRADLSPSPTAEAVISSWEAAGHSVRRHRVVGPAFWQTSEIELCPGLIEASVAAMNLLIDVRSERPLPA
jgi:exosortase A-associated hydrolase 2